MRKNFILALCLLLFTVISANARAADWVGSVFNSSTGQYVTDVSEFDWSSAGSGVCEGIGPVGAVLTPETTFIFRYQSRLNALIDTFGNTIIPPGLNSIFEYTLVAEIPQKVVSIDAFGKITFQTLDGGKFYIFHDSARNSYVPTGFGFDDGEVVVSGTFNPGMQSSFRYDPIKNTGSGSAFYLANILFINSSFITPSINVVALNFDSTLQFPVLNSATTSFFDGRSGEGHFATYTVASQSDLSLKIDANTRFQQQLCNGIIGDLVWYDKDRDGIQDAGEAAIPGVEVTLTNLDDNTSKSTTTTENGEYQFTGLCAGNYIVEVTNGVPAGYSQTSQQSGSDRAVDSNGSPAYVTLNDDASSDLTIDFGYVSPCSGSIGNFVWQDIDRDGLQDSGEPGLHNVKVTLTNTVTGAETSVFTNNGAYLFDGLCAGFYRVEVETPAGLSPTTAGVGSDSSIDSNAIPADVTLSEDNSSDMTIDFGYVSPCIGEIGDFVWHDKFPNGIQEDGEPGIEGVTIRLTTISNGETTTTVTVGGGLYTFSGLCPGDYKIEVDSTTLPPGFTPTTSLVGSDPALDSNGSPATTTLTMAVPSDLSIDFGYTSPCSGEIGDFIWDDLDRDGLQDVGEPGISGVTVILYNPNDNVSLQTATTDGNGLYRFTGLCAGNYKVEVVATAGALLSPTVVGDDRAVDSNNSPYVVILSTNESTDVTIDFGFFYNAAIGDWVWNDANRNGIQDADENGIPGVIVELYNCTTNVLVDTTTTDANGTYMFANLMPGSYRVKFVAPGYIVTPPFQGSNVELDSNADAYGLSGCIDLESGETNKTVDVGLYLPCTGTIGDFVWNDLDQNGIQDAGEPGLPGVTVTLSGTSYGQPVSITTTTNASGLYQFTGLCTGSYSVTVMPPAGYTASPTGQGTAATDSNGSPASVTLTTDSSTDNTIDFGFYVPCTGTIGDFVWNDLDQDGIQDAGEPGIPGVKVTLSTGAVTATDAAGFYSFTGLCAGTYTVTVETPVGFNATLSNQGSDRSVDSNGSPAVVTLFTNSASDFTIDFGFTRTTYGCTFTIGYWKNHAGFSPQPDVVTPLLPAYLGTVDGSKTLAVTTAKIAYDVLSENVYGTPENGITKLYAQLLAAKLNIKAGADPSAVGSIISLSDQFLAWKSYTDWYSLSSEQQAKVLSWQQVLDDYNNGLLGPGHCDSELVLPCIDISKQISVDGGKTWLDADGEGTAAIRTSVGTASYRLIVHNCGQMDLGNIAIDDPALGIINYLIPSLAAGATKTLTSANISKLATTNRCTTAGAFENVAYATAIFNDYKVSANDSAWLVCETTNACLDITKDISIDGGITWKPADTQLTAPSTTAPHSADYKITVSNCGSSTLSNVVLKDPDLGITSYYIGTLYKGTSKVYTYKQLKNLRALDACSTAGSFLNTAFISGTYNGITLADNDSAWLVCTAAGSSGCSYTVGYWKTHTRFDGKKKRNDTWDKCGGENALFFDTGQSWYQVLMTVPSENNAYYILAHQYIAAFLNKKAGADMSAVNAEFGHAEELLGKYDGKPYKMSDISGAVREDFIRTAATLDMFNNGEIGPGHCK